MKTLNVDLGTRSYPIHIGTDLLSQKDLVIPHVTGTQVLIVTNDIVAPLYLEQTKALFSDFNCQEVILPDGEKHKTLKDLNLIYDALLSNHFDRYCTLVALGGGVVGDMTGYAAASYQRGVNFIQIPTTLLSQVDSSVGGKTGVNHPLGKNMIGAFHQPSCVIADINTLNTLEDNQLSAGLAEVIKYGLIQLPDFIGWLEENINKLLNRDQDALSYAIEVSCQCKADVVAADEREGGIRALLNLGHTFGHAIESGAGYGNWLHGEAVGIGMLMAADLSMREGWISEQDVQRVKNIILAAKLPIQLPSMMTYEVFMDLMRVDKKVRDGKINFVLYAALGDAKVTHDFKAESLRATIEHFQSAG